MIKWIEDRFMTLMAAIGFLIALVWYSQNRAVNQYKDEVKDDAEKRSKAASDAARDARLTPDSAVLDRMRDKGWSRD